MVAVFHRTEPPQSLITLLVGWSRYYDQLQIVSRVQGADRRWGWAVNLRGIGTAMKQHCAESVVLHGTGEVGRRIWRMLLLQNKLEQRQVSR
jgi:hypothetical protein